MNALTSVPAGDEKSPLAIVNSLCGMCATHCPIQVTVRDGRVVWLQGNPNDKVMGASLCARGAAGVALESDDERPAQPMIRVGERGSGQWRHVSWDEALDHVADKLKAVIARDGARGVALSDRGGHFSELTRTFLQAIGSPNYCDHDTSCARNAHNAARSSFGRGRGGFAYDIRNTRHLVLYGRNIAESLMVKEVKDFMAARKDGARCTYIDPRATLTACKATRYWQIRPNSDYALNLAILRQVLRDEVYDKAFVDRWVSGMDYLREAVESCTPEWQEAHTGIPAAELRAFVDEIAKDAPHVIFHGGWMVARHRQSFYVSRTAYLLNALMGSVETRGGLIFAKSAKDVGRKELGKLAAGLPKVEEKRADGAGWLLPHIDPAAGMVNRLFAAMQSRDPYAIGAYIVYRHDPLTAMPDPEAIKRAWEKLDLIVAIDINYSETARYADVILPETTYLERSSIIAAVEGPKPSLIARSQAIEPRFDSKPGWWIFSQILKRLGLGERFPFENIEDIWRRQLEGTDVSIEALREKGLVALADKPTFFDRENGLPFGTPSKTVEIRSTMLDKAGLPSLAPYVAPPALGDDEFRLLFGRVAVHTHGQTMNNPMLSELKHDNPLWMHPRRARRLGLSDGQEVEVSREGVGGRMKLTVTDLIHEDAVFMLHGFGHTAPQQTRAYRLGVADQRLQVGMLPVYDPAGGGSAMTETVVRVCAARAEARS